MKSFQTARAYDRLAPFYDFWTGLTETEAQQQALKLIDLKPGEAVLEVAVGTAYLLARIRQTPGLGRCVGVDLSSGMLERARRRLSATFGDAGMLCRADARWLPFRNGTFDAVINCYMLDLLAEDEIPRVLAEFHRVLKPQGRLALAVMATQSRVFNNLWMWLYRRWPALVGGCRPVALAPFLRSTGWNIETQELITQHGFRSEVIVARRSGLG